MSSAVKSVTSSVGSALGSVGSAVGSVLGGVTGSLFGAGDSSSPGMFGTGSFKASPTQIDTDAFKKGITENEQIRLARANQDELTKMLQARARGEGESLAEKQMKAQTDRGLAQQRAGLAGSRGRLGALGQREFLRAQADQGQANSQQAALLRMQEQMAAQASLADQLAGQQAFEFDVAQADRIARQNLEELKVSQQSNINTVNLSGFNAAAQARQRMAAGVGTGMTALGSTADMSSITKGLGTIFSDKNLKENIKSEKGISKEFLNNLKPYSYNYKNEQHGVGRKVGIMAQDLEKAGAAGKSIVVDTPEGKMIDTTQGFGVVVAAMADFNERMKKLENIKSKSKSKSKSKGKRG